MLMLVEKREKQRTATSHPPPPPFVLSKFKNVEDQIRAAQAVLSRTLAVLAPPGPPTIPGMPPIPSAFGVPMPAWALWVLRVQRKRL